MKRSFYDTNELVYYAETAEELVSYEGKLPAGAIVEYNDGTELKVYMAHSNGTLVEL